MSMFCGHMCLEARSRDVASAGHFVCCSRARTHYRLLGLLRYILSVRVVCSGQPCDVKPGGCILDLCTPCPLRPATPESSPGKQKASRASPAPLWLSQALRFPTLAPGTSDSSSTRFPWRPQRRLQLGRLHARCRRQLDDLLVPLATQFVRDRRRRRRDLRLGHVSILGPRRRRARRVFVCGELRGRGVCGAASAPSQQEEDAYADEGGDGDAYAQAGAESGGVGFFFWRGGGRGCWC